MGAFVPMATTLFSTVVGLGNQSQQAQIQANQANYMAQVARNSQQAANTEAERALQEGQVQVEQQQLKTGQQIGSERAQLASQGGDVDQGSDLDVIGDTARTGAFNAQTLANNAAYTAWQRQLQAAGYAGQASLYGSQAQNAFLPFNNSLLGSAASVSSKWAPFLST